MSDKTAIILAAGMGKRMGIFAKDRPKVLAQVNNKTLLEYAIEFVKKIGISNIIVVGGYYFNKVKEEVNKVDPAIKLVENPDYELQNLTSLTKALPLVDDKSGLLICNSDYVFADAIAEAIASKMENISVYSTFDLSCDDGDQMKCKIDKNGNLIEMSKKLADFSSIYVGTFFFAAKYIPELKITAAEILKRYDNKKTTVEYLFSEFIKKDYKIKVQDIGRASWFEIDTSEELHLAQKALENFN